LRRGDSRQLAYGRPIRAADPQIVTQRGQRFQRFGDAQLLFDGARFVAEERLDVLEETGEPQIAMGLRAQRGEQRAPFLPFEQRATLCQTR
jgi:hypothetical protein